MSQPRTYLDFNAGAPLRPVARDAMLACLDRAGNPSSVHAEGRRARAAVERARGAVARLAGTPPDLVVFTSGATEAAALALAPDLAAAGRGVGGDLLVGATEHPAVLQGHRFPPGRVAAVPVDGSGVIDLAALDALLRDRDRPVLALQAANGETGVLQPVRAAARLLHARGGLLVCDAAQGAGRIDIGFDALEADILFFSGHKLGGPQGTGALAFRSDDVRPGTPLVRGGGQERGLRGGTENVAAIAGFGAAADDAASLSDASRWAALRDDFERRLRALAPDAAVFGAGAPRLANTSAFAIPGAAGETLLIALDLAGVAVSTGSACSSGRVSRSHVLESMGVDAHLRSGLVRVSFGWSSRPQDVDRVAEALGASLGRIGARLRSAA